MERLRRLRYVLLHELRARIMTLILVVFLPISIALITLSTTVLVRFSEQSRDRALHELSMQMTQMERDAVGVEHYADEFVRNYLMQINAPSGFSNAMLPYDMIEDLGRWYSYLDLPGFLYLYDNTGERCYTKYYGGTQDVSEKERLTKEVEGFAAVAGPMHFTLRDVGGRDYLCRTYEYRSCRIGFLIDAPECIYNALAGSWDERGTVYLNSTHGVDILNRDGSLTKTQKAFETVSAGNMSEEAVTWRSERTDLAVAVRYSRFYLLPSIPVWFWILLLLAMGCLLLFPLIWKVLRIEILEPVDTLTHALNELGSGNAEYRVKEQDPRLSDEMQTLYHAFNQSAERQKLEKEREVQLLRTQLDNLRLQVNPHMLLNSFNLIFAMAQSGDYQRIQDYCYLLVQYFRYVLRKNDDLVPLRQEIDFIKNYVEIQAIRHPDAFHYRCQVEPSCEQAMIPPLLVENFVENSMKYALSPGKVVSISVDIRREEERVRITVEDTGNGIAPEILEKLRKREPYVDPAGNRHIGVWNCMRRVELFYGERATFEIESEPDHGTTIRLKIPYREAQEE